MKFVIEHPERIGGTRFNNDGEWNWESISQNPGINMRDIENNNRLPWVWDGIFLIRILL